MDLPATFKDDAIISPYDELMAYEFLYATNGTSRSKISKLLADHGGLPTVAVNDISGLFPDSDTYREVMDYVNGRLLGFSVLVDGTPQFPASLRAEKNPLPVFYYIGDISLTESKCVSIVGTRNPSERGSISARRMARAVAERGYTVVTGLAKGIDTDATIEAIGVGGHVIGVIGTPIDRCYPTENKKLQETVAHDHLLISQVPIYRYDHQPFETRRYYFPERNITMAALCDATVIVEAGETSGTRTQAKACMEQGKTLIFLPSVIESTSWAQKYIDNGAFVASNVTEAMRILG